MNFSAYSFSSYDVVTLRHVSGLVHLPIMIELLVNGDLVTLLMTALGVVPLLSLVLMIHRHPDLVNLNLVILTLFLVWAMSP